MQKFILKKLFDIRPLTKKGEINLPWILRSGKIIKIKKVFESPAPEPQKKIKRIEKEEEPNYPAREKWRENIFSIEPDYEFEQIRQSIMDELEDLSLKEDRLKREFGPPVNLPIEPEKKKEKLYSSWLKKVSPQTINLRLNFPNLSLTPTLKYVLVGLLVLAVLVPSLLILPNFSSKKELILTSGDQGYQSLIKAQESLLALDPKEASLNFNQAYENFEKASKTVNSLGGSLLNIADILPLKYKVSSGKKLLAAGKEIAEAGTYLSRGLTAINQLSLEDIFKKDEEVSLDSHKPTFYLKTFKEEFSLAKQGLSDGIQYLKEVDSQDLPEKYQDDFNSLSQIIPALETSLNNFDGYFDLFLALLGDESPRHYLILFQNDSELRATGGFIGSYALLSAYQGQIDEIEVKNIFDADGQLIINVVPPKPIQKISSGWSTHDANWFFDFPTSAEKVAWFFEKTGGPTVDGIIALTPDVIENLLSQLGSINLEEYNLNINKDNFVEEIQFKVERDYDPYLNQPKQVLADFTDALFSRLAGLSKEKWPSIIQVFGQSIKDKDLIVWLKDEVEQDFVIEQGWSGEISDTQGDYLAIVHSNINGYKTDRFMEEDIHLSIDFKNINDISHQLTLTRRHKGGEENYEWYNKVNADYVRIYLPKGSEIISASGNTSEDNSVPPLDYELASFRRDDLIASIEATLEKRHDLGLDIFEESGKTVVGAWLYTSPNEKTTFTLNYKIPQIFSSKALSSLPIEGDSLESLSYNLIFQKQPGSYDAPLRTTIYYPDNWKIKQIYPRDKLTSQHPVRFRDSLNTDKIFDVNFKIN